MLGTLFLHVVTLNLFVMWIAPTSTNAIHQMMTITKMSNGRRQLYTQMKPKNINVLVACDESQRVHVRARTYETTKS